MTKIKHTEIPVYQEAEVIGKTFATIDGTADRRSVGRRMITTAAGFDGHECVAEGYDRTPIFTVAEVEEFRFGVEIVGGKKSVATWLLQGVYTLDAGGLIEVFVRPDQVDKIMKAVEVAKHMSAAAPECGDVWQFNAVDEFGADGDGDQPIHVPCSRCVFRVYAPVREDGAICREDIVEDLSLNADK